MTDDIQVNVMIFYFAFGSDQKEVLLDFFFFHVKVIEALPSISIILSACCFFFQSKLVWTNYSY